jgi:hypothetical protein
MTDLTEVLTEAQARRVEEKVLAYGRRANPGRFRHSVRYHVIAADPTAAERLRRTAKASRDVTGRDLPEGMGQLSITLEPHEAQAAYDQINALANKVKTPERSLAQCRADVFLDLVLGKTTERSPVNVNVVVPMSTLMGLNRYPGEITGFGPITAEYARELAQHATWRRMITDEHGHVLEVSRRRFASPALTRHIRLRDRTCRQPGCSRTAEHAQIDHTVRYGHGGTTTPDNTSALCRKQPPARTHRMELQSTRSRHPGLPHTGQPRACHHTRALRTAALLKPCHCLPSAKLLTVHTELNDQCWARQRRWSPWSSTTSHSFLFQRWLPCVGYLPAH